MSRKVRLLSAFSAVALLLASCGGGDSSGRTKNSALCYATQEEKDAAVQAARDAFDAAMGGGTPGDPLSDTTVPATEDSVVGDAPSDTVVTDSTSADGGGYRRPAIRVAASGDTTVPPSQDGGALTPEQQQAQMDLEAAESQPLCDNSETSSEISCEITLQSAGEWAGTSTCTEVTVQFVDTRSTTAIEWQATVGTQVVASGTWDAVTENTKVISFSYTPAQEENADSSETTEVTCTGTMSGEIGNSLLSDDCPDGYVYSSLSADGEIWVLNRNGAAMGSEGSVLASGPLDSSTLTPETPVTFQISYEIAGGGGTTDTTVASESDSPCSVTFTSTGISWSCNDGSLFNAEIEDMSNPGVYPGVYCASEGSFTVAEGQRFWFNFFLVNGESTFMDGWNGDRPQNEPIGFGVPEDSEGVCAIEEDPNPYQIEVPGVYGFTASDSGPTLLSFFMPGACSSENTFAINWYVYTDEDRYEYSSTSYAETFGDPGTESEGCGYYDASTYGGAWIAEFVGNANVNAVTNVPLESTDRALIETNLPELAELAFNYSFDTAARQYNFVLTEETRVSITVNSGQTCDYSQVDEEENGLVDPEIWLYAGSAPWSESNDEELAEDDNGYHAGDNCSSAYVDETLPAGNYFIWAENDDFSSGDTGTITVNSSVELIEYTVDFSSVDFTTQSATVPSAITIEIPAGGGQLIASLEAADNTCDVGDPALAVLDLSNGATLASDDDSGEDYLGLNCYSSYIDVKLEEGKYLLIVSTYEIIFDGYVLNEEGSGTGSIFELKYGFVSSDGTQQEIVTEPSTDPIPPVDVPPTPNLPVDQMKTGSGSAVGIPEGVETMVCDSTCVENLFALEGVTANELAISFGGESVVVKKGSSKVRVPVSAGSRDLVVTQKASDGSPQVVASTKVVSSLQKFGTTTSSSSTSEGSSAMNIILIIAALVIVAGAGAVVVRKKKSA